MKPINRFLNLILFSVKFYVKAFDTFEACEKDDIKCKITNVDLGILNWGQCQRENVLRRLEKESLLDCVKECVKTTSCKGINYRPHWHLCDITTDILEGRLTEENGCISSMIVSWKKTIAGKCAYNTCATGESCFYDNAGGTSCSKTYCSRLPLVENAMIVEKFGPYRNVDHGIRYQCSDGHIMLAGTPLAICRLSDEWEIMFKCEQIPYYIGCFLDDISRVLKHREKRNSQMTLKWCMHYCDGFRYLGLEAGVWCHCGDSLDRKKYPQVEEGDCKMPCSGDRSTKCGAHWRISIYQIRE